MNLNYPRLDIRSNCPRWSVIGVLITAMMADSRSERAFEVRGGE